MFFMEGKSLIVYYSWVGNTEVVAKEIQRRTGFDMEKIEEYKQRKLGSIMGAAMGAAMGFASRLKPMDFSLKGYENVFLGAQVWAGKTAPAINRYLQKARFDGKKVWLFVTKADEKVPQKVIDSITGRIEKKGGKVLECLSLTAKWDPKTNIPIAPESVQASVDEWLKKADVYG